MCSGLAETVIIRQSFDDFAPDAAGTVGVEKDEGGAWKDFGKRESSPKATDQEFAQGKDGSKGRSIRIIRDDAAVQTPDFWLLGSWLDPVDTGKARISFRVLRDSPDSGFSFHIGNAEKNAGVNTIALSIGNHSTSLEKLGVMTADGKWETTQTPLPVGSWMQIALDIDFSASTYTVSVDGLPVGEAIPFERDGALRRISFLPTHPNGNVSYIDDVEVVALD